MSVRTEIVDGVETHYVSVDPARAVMAQPKPQPVKKVFSGWSPEEGDDASRDDTDKG